MEKTLASIWIKEASYRYRMYFLLAAIMLFIPKPTTLFLENSIDKQGVWETYAPFLIEYLMTAVFGIVAFWCGHFSGYLLKRFILSQSPLNIDARNFNWKYVGAFAVGPMVFAMVFELLVIFLLRHDLVDFSNAAMTVGLLVRFLVFTISCLVIICVFGMFSLRGLKRFVKRHKDILAN